jgi:hypothetical protein
VSTYKVPDTIGTSWHTPLDVDVSAGYLPDEYSVDVLREPKPYVAPVTNKEIEELEEKK